MKRSQTLLPNGRAVLTVWQTRQLPQVKRLNGRFVHCLRGAISQCHFTSLPQNDVSHEVDVDRGTWSNKIEFVLSCVGMSVGIGNVWRFPFVAYENGGGTFQLAYLILLILLGMPLYFMEISRGQFSRLGSIGVWRSCPAAIGIGWAMIVICIIGIFYYNVLLAYTVVYMASSFVAELPWEKCQSWWGADSQCCIRSSVATALSTNTSFSAFTACGQNSSKETASEQYWEKFVLTLNKSEGINDLGPLQWKLVLALAFTWFCVFVCVFKGIKSIGKVVYFTATFPYVILLAFLIQSVLLDGATEGINFFFTPTWDKLIQPSTWMNASRQMVYSLGLANGALITLASYNTFHNKCHKDAMFVASLDFLTSIITSVVIFSALGYLAKDLHIPINKVVAEGQGLAFITFPEVVLKLPAPQFWCFSFFFMLFILGIDSTFAVFETAWSAVMDEIPFLRKYQTRIFFFSILGYFLLGLPLATAGGQYLLKLVDHYNTMSRTFIAALEVVAIMWIYGTERFCDDIQMMVGFRPNFYFRFSWKYLSPIVIIILTIISWANFSPPVYRQYEYPNWAHGLGWIIVLLSLGQIPLGACIAFYKHWKAGDTWGALKPTPEWGPSVSDEELKRNTTTVGSQLNSQDETTF